MTRINIPPAALEAGKRWICRNGCGPDVQCAVCTGLARAAFEAMVEAWPGMWSESISGQDFEKTYSIVLPLPTEASDE